MGRRLAALLIVVMINAAMLPSAAAASISDSTTIDYPVDFEIDYSYPSRGSPNVYTPFYWPLTSRPFRGTQHYGGYTYAVVGGTYLSVADFISYPYQSNFYVFTSEEGLITTNRFLFNLFDFSPAFWDNRSTVRAPADIDDFSYNIGYYSISYYLVDSTSGDVVSSYKDYISLPIDGSWHSTLGLGVSFSEPKSFDTVVVGIDVHYIDYSGIVPSSDRASTNPAIRFSSANVSSTSSTTIEIDGTNETLDQFFDSYQEQFDQASAGIVTNLNTGISTIVSSARQESNTNINEFVQHSGSSEQETLDWGFRNTMIAINNAGAQVSHSIGQAASSTVAATQAAAQNISQNVVATGETINKTLTGLPEAIGNKVTDLFVPKEEDLAAIKDDYEGLLEEKLGAVYQVEQYGQNLFGSVAAATETDTITFPGISVPVGQGENFVMESAEVAVFPAGLDVLKNCVKFLVTAAFVAAWVLGLQRYYDKIMGDRGDE